MTNLDISLTLRLCDQLFVDTRRIALLKAIAQTGSLSQAAKLVGISYKTAWDAINTLNQLADIPFVTSSTGGKGGGGAELSQYAKRFMALYDSLIEIQHNAFDLLNDDKIPTDDLLKVAASLSLQSSARNQLYGTISAIHVNEVAGYIMVLLQDGSTEFMVYITQSSIERLNLFVGKRVLLMIKAPQVEISPLANVSQNRHTALIKNIKSSNEWGELTLEIGSGITFYASRPMNELTESNIKSGQRIAISVHPENIIIATMC